MLRAGNMWLVQRLRVQPVPGCIAVSRGRPTHVRPAASGGPSTHLVLRSATCRALMSGIAFSASSWRLHGSCARCASSRQDGSAYSLVVASSCTSQADPSALSRSKREAASSHSVRGTARQRGQGENVVSCHMQLRSWRHLSCGSQWG